MVSSQFFLRSHTISWPYAVWGFVATQPSWKYDIIFFDTIQKYCIFDSVAN